MRAAGGCRRCRAKGSRRGGHGARARDPAPLFAPFHFLYDRPNLSTHLSSCCCILAPGHGVAGGGQDVRKLDSRVMFPFLKGLRQGWLKLQATLGSTPSPSRRSMVWNTGWASANRKTVFYLKDTQDTVRNSDRCSLQTGRNGQ